MNVLLGCEISGAVRRAMRARGHNAWSCDLEESWDRSPYHLVCDLRYAIAHGVIDPRSGRRSRWDLLIAFPPCQYLCSSGLWKNTKDASRQIETLRALNFVETILAAKVPKIALENPVGRIGTAIRPADQYIQPYEFGDDASKRTGLWLKGLPLLVPTKRVPGRWVTVPAGVDAFGGRLVRRVERWANQTDSGQNRLGPSDARAAIRAETYPGIAAAMADQWGG